jgi:hypothetical protein
VSVHYDAGALVAADRNDRAVWAHHTARLELGIVPITTAPVIAQASRSPRQAQLRRFLRGCHIRDFTKDDSHPVGALLAKSNTADIVGAHLVLATADDDTVITSDPDDVRRLAGALNRRIRIREI